ncbi:hypothetical protein HDV01_007519 [Terramyces sp. JEL0728]|nr:hypothetical protein HDV01_007519 [Terramyces sp. JEL0728]
MEKKQVKLIAMMFLSSLFFLAELIGGYSSGSISLIADSFHMLSDVAALFIAFYASKLAKSKDVGPEYSYGLKRAEVLGALINGVSLLALSLTLIIEAIQRYFTPEHVTNPWAVLYVASAGLCMNIVGMFLFHGHGHSHSHTHDHGEQNTLLVPSENVVIEMQRAGENPIQLRENVIRVAQLLHEREASQSEIVEDKHARGSTSGSLHRKHSNCAHDHDHAGHLEDDHRHDERTEVNGGHSHSEEGHSHDGHNHEGHSHGHAHDMNMHGVFLHILGDLLTSLGVITAVLIIIFVDQPWTIYVDPTMSLLITFIIINSTIPLVRSACYILVQGTPHTVSIDALRNDILTVDGVQSVHELHVWQLSDTQTIASVHVVVPRPDDTSASNLLMEERYMMLAASIKNKLHVHGIHSTTVQPEFQSSSEMTTCMLRCTTKDCEEKTCCPPN